jgi:hypothetical protein
VLRRLNMGGNFGTKFLIQTLTWRLFWLR